MIAGVADRVRLTAVVSGQVQGVGFRWAVQTAARQRGLAGWARNHTDGTVEVVADGPRQACADLAAWLESGDGPGEVATVKAEYSPVPDAALTGFVIR